MPDNETNDDNTNKRPKRRAAQRTYMSYENTSVWNEDKDLKRALLASLQDVKKSVPKTSYEQNGKNNSNVVKKSNKNDVFPKLNANNSSQSICKDNQSLVDNNLLSLAAHRRARVSAQRKFASGFSANSPVSTPIKTGFVASTNVVDLFPNQKPKTEDFLTFLCLRRSPILPPNLDFIRLENERKVNEEKKPETDSENISNDELEASDKYTTCRLRASVDRRGSSSSIVSKAASVGSKASLQISNRKKFENQRNDNKFQNSKRHQFLTESSVKNLGSDLNQNVRQSHQNSKSNSQKSEESKPKTFDSLKQKYKQQRIDKKSSNPSKTLTTNKKNDSKINANNIKDKKKSEPIGIQTRQQLRNHPKNDKELDSKHKSISKDSNSGPTERVLRSNRSIIVSPNTNEYIQKTNKSSSAQKTNLKKNKSLNSSQIGIRPKKRKARPVVPLIDYYFDSEFESDSEKKSINKEENNSSNSQEFKTKNSKNNSKDNKNKKTSKPVSEELRTPPPSHSKTTKKSKNKSKTSLSSEPRRLTRSSRPFSPPKEDKDLERERQIKQRIIEIERKHKRLRRCPSNQSLHSSTSSSSSSSESLPNSLSSSSSINNTRLTRSLEHLKKIRDIAAKLKKEQNKKEDKNKNIVKNKVNNRKIKQNVIKLQNSIETQTNESSLKNIKTKKPIKKSIERTVTRSMRDSVVSAMSDTDCDTEGDECQECEQLVSGMSATEDSLASILGDDMERASIVIQDMAEDINTLLVNSSDNDLQYGSTEHIQGLMTCEFSGAFSDETITTASAILLPTDCHSEYSYVQTDDSRIRSTVDASTNTAEEDILCVSSDETNTDSQYEYSSQTLSVGTQTTVSSSVQTDGSLDC